ncbi:MAG: hypothetical protein ABEJ72_11280, partial [Candidatus Aenigmatarchaeota archaeon]
KNHSDGFDPVSAGTEAGKPIIEEVKKEMQRREVWSYSKESPEQLTGEDVSSADTVICMKKRHAELLKDRYGAGSPTVWSIKDVPIDQPKEDLVEGIRRTFDQLERKIDDLDD